MTSNEDLANINRIMSYGMRTAISGGIVYRLGEDSVIFDAQEKTAKYYKSGILVTTVNL